MISKKSLEKFKELYKKRFNKKLSNDEALRRASKLLGLYRAIYCSPASYQTKEQLKENRND